MMGSLRGAIVRIAILALCLTIFAGGVSAYSFWVFFPNASAPFAPLPAKFDLRLVKDNTVQFFISEDGPGALVAGDSATAVYSEIRQAAAAWNNVPSSALRLQFGGFTKIGLAQNTPGVDVVFDDDMPPGLLAQTSPLFPADLTFLGNKNTTFVPILRSRVQLRRDMALAGPSYADATFMTFVHEFGHALGLQHSFTSGAMSTAITRAASKGLPLADDDVAGISLLYPVGGWQAGTGSISGRVTRSGDRVNLASVVALSLKGAAISTLSNPDGTYRIDGLPPGQYYVYVHPLPPAATGEGRPGGVMPPADPQNDDFSATTGFGTQFFPGTRDWTQASLLDVAAGTLVDQVNFAVTPRSGPAVYGMTTYGYQNNIAVPAPPLPSAKRNAFVFYAPGTTVNNQSAVAPGLRVSVIGTAADIEAGSLRYYTQGFLLMVVDTSTVTDKLPVALAVNVDNDLYVLPTAFSVVPSAPPVVASANTAVALGAARTTVSGANFDARTRFLFDGVPAAVSFVSSDGTTAEITEPPALSGYQATVEAVNADGQTSLQALGPNAPPVFTYPQRDPVSITATGGSVIAGTDALITITGVNTHFAQGRTIVGFGSSDIAVRRIWVIGPGALAVNVSVDPSARVGTAALTVTTGLESITVADAVRVLAADPAQISLRVPVINAVTGLAGVPAGGTALIATTGLPSAITGWTLKIGGVLTTFSADKNGVLSVHVPNDLAVGPQTVQLTPPGNAALPVPLIDLQLDSAPPSILVAAITASDGTVTSVTPSAPARPGDSIALTVSGLAGSEAKLPAPGEVWIHVNGFAYQATAVNAVPQDGVKNPQDLSYVSFVLPASLTADPAVQPLVPSIMIRNGTRLSSAFNLNVAAPPPAK